MPDLDRRSVLLLGAGVLGALAIPTAASAATVRTSAVPMRSHYLAGLGKVFTANLGAVSHRLRLIEILDLVPSTAVGDERSFNLIFQGTQDVTVASGIYRLTARGVTGSTLHLSAVDLPTGRPRLQALVNRSA